MRKFIAAAIVLIGAIMLAGIAAVSAATTTVKVTAADLGGADWFAADTRPPGTGAFESGPALPPYGTGSFQLSTPDNTAKVQLFTDLYNGAPLSAIDGIGYSTYRDPSSAGFVAGVNALNIRVDLDGAGTTDVYMVYEPYQDQGNAAVQTGVWQDWDAYNSGQARWWINTGAGGCGQNTPCTWTAILALFPNATVREGLNCGPAGIVAPCPGSLGINQGSFNSGIVSNADGLYISVSGNKTIYDFELPVGPPTSKDDCKNGGWQQFDAPRTFNNQGDCIQYVNTGK